MSRFILIDGNSLLFRAFYALSTPMTSQQGIPTGAIHGFLSMLLKLLEQKPEYMAVAFDRKEPTFRHKQYTEYKAGRKPAPPELLEQLPILRRLLREMGIAELDLVGYEADDILGTLSKRAANIGIEALIVTGDRDALQLTSEQVHVLLTRKGISDTVEYTPELLKEQYGLRPENMKDLKALMGDNSDNIPGVPGVGEKTALKLLAEYGDLNGVLAHASDIKGKLGEKIRNNADSARLSYWLGTICTEAPLELNIEDCAFTEDTLAGAEETLRELGLKTILSRLPRGEKTEHRVASVYKPERTVLQDEQALAALIEAHRGAKTIALCMEPSFSLAFKEEQSYELEEAIDLFSQALSPSTVLHSLAPLLKEAELLCYDSKALWHCLDKEGIPPCRIAFDARIADYLLNSNRPGKSYEELCQDRFRILPGAAGLFALRSVMEQELRDNGMETLYNEMEMPLTEVLFSMEREGFAIDKQVLFRLKEDFTAQLKELELQIMELAGESFNILSPKQLGYILFEKLGLPHGKKKKNGYSTNSDTLEMLMDRHPIVPLIGQYRFLAKLNATFVEGLLKAIDDKGRVHSSFNQCVTATGRISSTEPNLQNIPVRTPQGAQIRKAFVASPGHQLVGADYSQIELRLLAHISKDEGLINAFNTGEDIHRRTASEVFATPMEEVSKQQRSAAKAVNFGIVYGISDFGLARNLNIPVKTAAGYIKSYLDRYPGVQAYMLNSVKEAAQQGYAVTLYNRRRPLPELKSSNYNTRSFGERVAMNMPIQGSAADIIKMAMVHVHESLKERDLKSKLVLQIHDELLVDAPLEEVEEVERLMESCMQQAAALRVQLVAEATHAYSWYDTK